MKTIFKSSILLLTVVSAILLTMNACIKGKGDVVQELLTVDSFTGVKLKGSFDVEVVLGGQQSVTAEGNQNIIDRIIARVNSDGVLELELEKGNYKEFQLKIYVSVPVATYFAITGSGDMSIVEDENLTFDDLQLFISGSGNMSGIGEFRVSNTSFAEITGSGNMNFNLNSSLLDVTNSGSGNMIFDIIANEIDADITGSGNLNCTGFAPTQILNVSGSGNYKGFFVESQNTTVDLSGSGNAECKVNTQLNATLSGSGSVYYKGSPVINATITASGEVIDAN